MTVAIVDAYASPTLFQDAHEFAGINDPGNPLRASQFSELLANKFTQGGPNQCDASGWFGEQTLDVEAADDMAPGANILFAGARNCNTPALNRSLRAPDRFPAAPVPTGRWRSLWESSTMLSVQTRT